MKKSSKKQRWWIVVAAFSIYFCADGYCYSLGLFVPNLARKYQFGSGQASIIPTLLYGLPLIFGPCSCVLVELYSCRCVGSVGGLLLAVSLILSMFMESFLTLVITAGLIGSVGLALSYVPAIVSVTIYSENHRGLATGIVTVGSGLGAVMFPLLIDILITEYHFEGCLLILGGLMLNIIPFSLMLVAYQDSKNIKSINKSIGQNMELTNHEQNINDKINEDSHCLEADTNSIKSKSSTAYVEFTDLQSNRAHVSRLPSMLQEFKIVFRSIMDKSILTNRKFVLLCISSFLSYLFIGIPFVYIYHKALLDGLTARYATILLSIIAISRMIGLLFFGWLSDHRRIRVLLLYAFCIIFCGFAMIIMPFLHYFWWLSIVCAIYGISVSVTYCLPTLILVELVGMTKMTAAFGILQLFQGVSTLLGTPLAGQSYSSPEDGACLTRLSCLLHSERFWATEQSMPSIARSCRNALLPTFSTAFPVSSQRSPPAPTHARSSPCYALCGQTTSVCWFAEQCRCPVSLAY